MPKYENAFWSPIFIANAFLCIFRGFAKLCGPLIVIRVFGMIGRCLPRFREKDCAICIAQIEAAKRSAPQQCVHPFFSLSSIEQTKSVFEHAGRIIGEALLIPQILGSRRIKVEGVGNEIVDELINANEGAVCISGHIGCFELLAAYHVSRGVPLSVIARFPNIAWLGTLLERVRRAYGVEIVWREDKASGRKLVNALTSGKFLAALIDQDTKLDNKFAPFFGIQACHPIMPIRMAIRSGRPILASFIVRTSANSHRVETTKIEYDADSESAEQDVLNRYAELFNELVAQYPDQWVWWHKRWRRQPSIDYSAHPEKLLGSMEYVAWLNSLGRQGQS